MKIKGGLATLFQKDYLEYNIVGTKIKGMTVEKVSNKYIYTECRNKILKKGLQIQFKEHPESLKFINYQPPRHS